MEGNEWILDYNAKLGRTLCQYAEEKLGRKIHLAYGYGFMNKAMDAYAKMWEHGALAPAGESFNGGYGGRGEVDLEAAADWHHEHGCYMTFSIFDHTAENGPVSAIEEEMKELVMKHKHMPKFVPGFKATYWTPQAHIDAAVAAVRKYGRYE